MNPFPLEYSCQEIHGRGGVPRRYAAAKEDGAPHGQRVAGERRGAQERLAVEGGPVG